MATAVLSKSKFNVYTAITNKIVAAIEAGASSFKMPWHATGVPLSLPMNVTTYSEYRGINVLSLWIAGLTKGYPTGEWATYKQWQDIDAQVRRGEQGTLIVFYKQVEISPLEEQDTDQAIKRHYFARPSWVFNAAQCDGYKPREPEKISEWDRYEVADAFTAAVGAKIEEGHQRACYRHDIDLIEMPKWEWFIGTPTSTCAESYYAVLLHELTHWTGAEHRLGREFGQRFGDQAYAVEELVAELGSAFLCATLGISLEPREDHAAYIADWLKVLKSDSRAIFTAASAAQEAHEYLIGRVTQNDEPSELSAK